MNASDAGPVRIVVTADAAGRRIDVVLASELGLSRSAAAQRIDAGLVRIDGRTVRRSRVLEVGETVEVADAAAPPRVDAPPVPPVRYRDEHLLVLAKPPGLVVHPGAGHAGDTLVDALAAAGVPLAASPDPTRPGVVHRLDRDTSGLLVVASTHEALAGLVAMLAERRIVRRYLTIVDGVPAEARGVVDAPIGRHPERRTRFAVVDGARPARTRYRLLATGEVTTSDGTPRAVSTLVCGLETGRTHQIRVHLQAVGSPVAGDPVYGADGALAAALGLTRPALHAAHLAFDHPVTGEPVVVDEPLPDDLVEACARAGLAAPPADATP